MVCWRPAAVSPAADQRVLVAVVATLIPTSADVGNETEETGADDGTTSEAADEIGVAGIFGAKGSLVEALCGFHKLNDILAFERNALVFGKGIESVVTTLGDAGSQETHDIIVRVVPGR